MVRIGQVVQEEEDKKRFKVKDAVAGDQTRVTRVTGGNTYHYTTTTLMVGGLTYTIF